VQEYNRTEAEPNLRVAVDVITSLVRSAARLRLLRWQWMVGIMARNKRSSQDGGGRITGTASPLSEAQRHELAEAIVNHLKPWKNNNTRDTVMAAVNRSLDVLPEYVAMQTKLYDPRSIRKHAKKLDKALSNVQRLLPSGEDPLAFLLFDPRPALMQDYIPAIQARRDESCAELERLRSGFCSGFWPSRKL
jgi:hypothetical protein